MKTKQTKRIKKGDRVRLIFEGKGSYDKRLAHHPKCPGVVEFIDAEGTGFDAEFESGNPPRRPHWQGAILPFLFSDEGISWERC